MDNEPAPDVGNGSGVRTAIHRWRDRPLTGALAGDLALVALVVAACALLAVVIFSGGSSSDDALASGSEEAAGESSAGGSDQALVFAQCMRDNGVPNFPDPVDGGFMITPEAGLSMHSSEFQAAREACQDVAPEGLGGGAGPSTEMQEQVLAFARCMRENGVDFPDPDVQGGGVRITGEDIDPSSPEFEAAREACAEHMQGLSGPGGHGGPGAMRGGN